MADKNVSTDLVTADDVDAPVVSVSGGIASFDVNEVKYSAPLDTWEDKLSLLNAMTVADKLSDFINKRPGEAIDLINYAIQRVDITDDETGEVSAVPRIFLIGTDSKGEPITLSTISKGVFNSVTQIVSLLGSPSEWPAPLSVRPAQLDTSKGRVFTLIPQLV